MKRIESLLNNSEISHFEITKYTFIVHLKNGGTVEVSIYDEELSITAYDGD
jgi:coenzyme F420-reducing hydrogenase beta subunit